MTTTLSAYGAEISFSPKWWSYVSSTRIMVSSFCNVALANEGIADKIAMTAQELLENAVKYSSDEQQNVSLRFTIHDESHISLEVSNHANPAHIAVLRDQHAEVNEGDPLMAYLQKMQRVAMDPNSDASQLGLARIRYETGNDLELRIDGQTVTMRVEFDLKEAA
ncbi:MAG TPA: hypothetical protein V6D47_04280 [Oscillatoriaceae cyanobacterium]